MFDVILACDEEGGLGRGGSIPWRCPEDLALFKKKTMGCNLIVGRKTYDTLPRLEGRKLYVVTRDSHAKISKDENVAYCGPLEGAIDLSQARGVMTFVIGGGEVYHQVFRDYPQMIHTVHLTLIDGTHDCDTLLDMKDLFRRFDKEREEDLGPRSRLLTYRPKTSLPKAIKSLADLVAAVQPSLPEEKEKEKEKEKEETIDISKLRQLSGGDEISARDLFKSSDPHPEKQYLDLVKEVLASGSKRKTRNSETRSLFARQLKYDLRDGFPLVTTRRTFFRGVVAELLFFLRGDTDTNKLEEQDVNIWKGNTSREFLDQTGKGDLPNGMMGPMYGYQWRSFNAQYDEDSGRPRTDTLPPELGLQDGVDQLAYVVNLIKTDPTSRRIMMTSYNPEQAEEGVLYPCHSIVSQFYVDEEFLDMYVYNRSQDLALGVPFNIASSALLLLILAKITGKVARDLTIGMGDCHVYADHVTPLREQLTRTPFPMPTIGLPSIRDLNDLSALTTKDFSLTGYKYHPSIKMDMVA